MSLVNDALRRAKLAQQNQPPASIAAPKLRPAEPVQTRKNDFLLIWATAFVAAFLIGILWHREVLLHRLPTQNSRADMVAAAAAPKTIPAPEPPTAPAAVPANPVAATKTNSLLPATNAVVAELPAPKPVTPRLQAVFFDPRRPSAIINGKTLFVGDRTGEFRVTAIRQDSATLAGTNQTLVLTME